MWIKIKLKSRNFFSRVSWFSCCCMLLMGCASTKYSTSVACLTDFTIGQKVLVADVEELSVQKSYNLYQTALKVFEKADLVPVYALEDEMNLRLYQVAYHSPDSADLAVLAEKLGYDYLLIPSVIDRKTGESLAYNRPDNTIQEQNDISRDLKAYEEAQSRAAVKFLLFSTKARRLVFELTATTETHPLSVPDEEGGEDLYNFSSSEDAMYKAYRKGLKKMMKECECCSGINL